MYLAGIEKYKGFKSSVVKELFHQAGGNNIIILIV